VSASRDWRKARHPARSLSHGSRTKWNRRS
jgi:hypothetical protein